ncbi:MAG: DUF3142 domain-containing protein [Cyanobacteria bacterium SZAS-4]|nr:DUF3142 domain-containing protein [Cyanobacteria bacterium SZAS-4]
MSTCLTPALATPETSKAPPALPRKVLWAWKRAEDLSGINPHEFGVAYLACHILLSEDKVEWQSRNQPLKVPPNTVVVPTVRIDVDHRKKTALSAKQVMETTRLILKAARAPHAAQVQIDFDALETERDFYRALLKNLRQNLPEKMPISITALASWCLFDNWIKDLPIDESVPMMFSLGRERDKVLLYFRSHRDFLDERAKRSLGLSLEDTGVNELMIPITEKRKIPVRIYVFTKTAWTDKKLQAVNTMLENL